MVTMRYQYPGDPTDTAVLMFGKEFVDVIRGGQDQEIRITNLDGGDAQSVPVPADDVVCDLCNAPIGPFDACVSIRGGNRLHCAKCFDEWIKPHIVTGSALAV